MSALLEFYRGAGVDARGRTLAELWAYSDGEMEAVHDFIQWMFPLREPSRFNPDAPLVSDIEVAAFRVEPALRANLRRSLGRFLAFVGLKMVDGRVVEAADFARKAEVFRRPNHNWLRISRVLASTRVLGLAAESRAFHAALLELQADGRAAIAAETLGYWRLAAE